jgi:hypothetical protein
VQTLIKNKSAPNNLGEPPVGKGAKYTNRLFGPFPYCCRAIRATKVACSYPSRSSQDPDCNHHTFNFPEINLLSKKENQEKITIFATRKRFQYASE